MSKELGKKIRAIRLKRNLSQSTMADLLGYSGKGMISRLENDSAEMSYEKLMLLLSKFGDDFSQEEEAKLLPISEREQLIESCWSPDMYQSNTSTPCIMRVLHQYCIVCTI